MNFADDIDQDSGPGPKPVSFNVGKAKAVIEAKKDAPLEKTEFKALLKVTGGGVGNDRSGADIVTVVDVSGSMGAEEKIGKLKIAMEFLIRKLSPSDRLSIVTFSDGANEECDLCHLTTVSQNKLITTVQGLKAHGGTNIKAGLETALKVLKDRKSSEGRVGAIMLMSDGEEGPVKGATDVKLEDVPVHTFGFGERYNPSVLNAIAKNSKEGTFALAGVDNTVSSSLSMAFSQCLAGLLTVSVQDLKVTVQPFKAKVNDKDVTPEKLKVFAGDYEQSEPDQNDGSITVSFGNLYMKEKRTVLVRLLLPRLTQRQSTRVLKITYSYRSGADLVMNPPIIVTVTRTADAVDPEIKEIVVEEKRLQTVNMMKGATDMVEKNMMKDVTAMAKKRNLEDALEQLEDTLSMLDDVAFQDQIYKHDIDTMKSEVQQYKTLMSDSYESQGRPFGLSSETSHARQRFSARGDPYMQRQFSTPRMEAYRDQAKTFDNDQTKLPTSADKDGEEEIAADPLAPFAGALGYYLEQAIQALQAMQIIIARRT